MKVLSPFFITLVLFAALGQIGSDLYLPSLPSIASTFHASISLTQLSVALYMLGFSFSQLIYGPLSDATGRLKPLYVGLSIFLVGSLVCLFATSIHLLILGRFLQGLGVGAGITLSLSILRDVFDGPNLAKYTSYLTMINIVLMASAPLLGGYLEYYFGWRANFVFLLAYVIIVMVCISIFIAETNEFKSKEHLRPSVIKNNLLLILRSNEFWGYGGCIFFAYAGILAWLTLGPILLQETIGLTPVQFGWIAFIVSISFIIGALINAKLVCQYGIKKMVFIGLYFWLLSAILLTLFSIIQLLNIYVIVIPVIFFIIGVGFVMPSSFAGGIIPFRKIAGIAGALLGFTQIIGGFASSSIISFMPDDNLWPLTMVLLVSSIVGLAIFKQTSAKMQDVVSKH